MVDVGHIGHLPSDAEFINTLDW